MERTFVFLMLEFEMQFFGNEVIGKSSFEKYVDGLDDIDRRFGNPSRSHLQSNVSVFCDFVEQS